MHLYLIVSFEKQNVTYLMFDNKNKNVYVEFKAWSFLYVLLDPEYKI
jgi:hypothetical protein